MFPNEAKVLCDLSDIPQICELFKLSIAFGKKSFFVFFPSLLGQFNAGMLQWTEIYREFDFVGEIFILSPHLSAS